MSGRGNAESATRAAWPAALALLAVYAVCFAISPAAAFFEPVEGASWALMASLESRWWTGAALEAPAAEIDPLGAFADPFTRARDGRWYSKAPPLVPLAASFPFAILGSIGAYVLAAASAIAALFVGARIAGRLSPGPGSVWGAVAATSGTPLLVHGALLCGHAAAAALALGAAHLFMAGAGRGFPSRPEARRPILGSLACAIFAVLAQPETIWLFPALLAAWAILRVRRARIAVSEGARWGAAFLALASALYAAAAILAEQLGLAPFTPDAGGMRWGSAVLIPVMPPAVLAIFGLFRLACGAWPGLAPRFRVVWGGLVIVGMLLQAGGLAEVVSVKVSNARFVRTVEQATEEGGAVVTDAAWVPALAAALAPSRAILYLGPEAPVEVFLSSVHAAGVRAFAAVSPAARGEVERLVSRRSLGRYTREGEPRVAGGLLVARFVDEGPSTSRPSGPPRGD